MFGSLDGLVRPAGQAQGTHAGQLRMDAGSTRNPREVEERLRLIERELGVTGMRHRAGA